MSGIYGVWQPFAAISQSDMEGLENWNKAYGETLESDYADESFFLGCSYESFSETKPELSSVLKAAGKYAVIDALLYNRQELIDKGQLSDRLSDEELIFNYMEKLGFDALRDVNGDFAGAVYDGNNGTLTLFRDHMGVRPLFYCATEHGVTFSTDIRGIVSMQTTDVSVNERWLWNNLAGTAYIDTENTEFAHIFCVKPASYISFDLKEEAVHTKKVSYWQPGSKKIRLGSERAYIERLRELVTDSVKRRLDAVPGVVGAELSGGLDSGILDILIHRLGREAVYVSWSASPKTLAFAENDERLIIEDICRQEDISCHYTGMTPRFAEESIIYDKMRAAGIEPDMHAGFFRRFVFPPYINTIQIGQTAQYVNSRGARVVFTGHGGDEGVSHRANPYEMFYNREYIEYLKYMWNSTRGERHRLYKTVMRGHKNLTVSAKKLKSAFLSVYAAENMLDREFFNKYNSEKKAANPFAYDPLSYVKTGGSRNRLDVTALLGAYCGARYMVPYLDYRVIDFVLSIPRHMFIKNGKSRYIFREAFKDIMPKSLYNLSLKADTSWKNAEKKDQDINEYKERKKRLFGMLDRQYWEKYLNWDVISQWVDMPPAGQDDLRDKAMLAAIDNCLSLQNLIEFSKKAKLKDKT